ncbi:MAG: CHAT domain-containing protein [Lewinellaceae bacterium]|nr:CHAT domain-containing protein [Lewinellaceae bacterium]
MSVNSFFLYKTTLLLFGAMSLFVKAAGQNRSPDLSRQLVAIADKHNGGAHRLQVIDELEALRPLLPAAGYLENLKFYELYVDCLENLISDAGAPSRRRLLLRQFNGSIESSIDIAYEVFHSEQPERARVFEWVFNVVNRNRNFQLKLNHLDSKVKEISTHKEEAISRRKNLIKAYRADTSELNREKILERISRQEAIRDSLSGLETSLIEQNDMQVVDEDVSLEEVQLLLDTDEFILHYFVGEQDVFLFLISRDFYTMSRCERLPALKRAASQYQKALQSSREQFIEAAHYLYKGLFAPVESYIPKEAKICVVPDNFLGTVSFESLSKTDCADWDRDYRNVHFLVEDYQFSYQHSTYQYIKWKEVGGSIRMAPEVALFAPIFDEEYLAATGSGGDTAILKPLPDTEKFAEQVYNILNARCYLREDATVRNFYKALSEGEKILHFSTHTFVIDTMPTKSYIALAHDEANGNGLHQLGKLTAGEVYQLAQGRNINFIVLGSCQTGRGELATGEGLAGFAYGFSLAGVPGLAYSLWRLEEKSTNAILISFYEGLRLGLDKDEALRKAKLIYLSNADQNTSNPFYWAGLVIAGDRSGYVFPSPEKGTSWLAKSGGGVLLALIVLAVFAYWLKNKRREFY